MRQSKWQLARSSSPVCQASTATLALEVQLASVCGQYLTDLFTPSCDKFCPMIYRSTNMRPQKQLNDILDSMIRPMP